MWTLLLQYLLAQFKHMWFDGFDGKLPHISHMCLDSWSPSDGAILKDCGTFNMP